MVARAAAETLIAQLAAQRQPPGTVVDLGCGSGLLAERLCAAGFPVVGVDFSADMLEIARRRAPAADLRQGSVWSTKLPPALAVTAIGEVLNYCFDRQPTQSQLAAFLRRVFRALSPGGLLLFDVAGPGRAPHLAPSRGGLATENWACVAEASQDAQGRLLTRRISTFVRDGQHYRRHDELHRLRLWPTATILSTLRDTGFRAKPLPGYEGFSMPTGWTAFLARRPR